MARDVHREISQACAELEQDVLLRVVGCGDGARVYAPDGTYLGRFAVDGGVSNLCFGGEDGRTLLLLSETRAYAVRMRVRGALL